MTFSGVLTGCSLEIGGGSGNLKEFWPDVISSDIVPTPWINVVADAQKLPFKPESFSNIIMIDVLHHIEHPYMFLNDAERVLRTGGRIIMIEPAITPFSSVFYRWLHPEPVDMSVDPLEDTPQDPNREPFDANQAIPTLLFNKYRSVFGGRFSGLSIKHIETFDFLAYPLSGGFRNWSLIPASAVSLLDRLERIISPVLGKISAFRMLAVLEKTK